MTPLHRSPLALVLRIAAVSSGVLLIGCALACSPKVPWYDANPRLSVHVWGGFASESAAPGGPQRIEVLVDASASMQTPMVAGPSRAQVARAAATRFVLELPADALVRVSGVGSGERCEAPRPVGRSAAGEGRVKLVAGLAVMETGEEGSIAHGLTLLADSLRARGESTRVVAFSDLSEACGADLCEATAALEAAGATLDLVVIGDAAIPECVAATRRALGTSDLPPLVGEQAASFRVLRYEDGEVVAQGAVGGPPVEVAFEQVKVVVDLDPPLSIGPIRLAPDAATRLEILEFPWASPRVREWRWDTTLETGAPSAP